MTKEGRFMEGNDRFGMNSQHHEAVPITYLKKKKNEINPFQNININQNLP